MRMHATRNYSDWTPAISWTDKRFPRLKEKNIGVVYIFAFEIVVEIMGDIKVVFLLNVQGHCLPQCSPIGSVLFAKRDGIRLTLSCLHDLPHFYQEPPQKEEEDGGLQSTESNGGR